MSTRARPSSIDWRAAVGVVKSIYDLQDAFHDAVSAGERDRVRQQMCDLGFPGVASTIRTVADGGVDARRSKRAEADPYGELREHLRWAQVTS